MKYMDFTQSGANIVMGDGSVHLLPKGTVCSMVAAFIPLPRAAASRSSCRNDHARPLRSAHTYSPHSFRHHAGYRYARCGEVGRGSLRQLDRLAAARGNQGGNDANIRAFGE